MAYDVTVDQELSIVCVSYQGDVTADERKAARDKVFQLCEQQGLFRVLVDLRLCAIKMNEKDAVGFAASFERAKNIQGYRLACVCKQQGEVESLVEVLLTNEGINIKYFLSPEDARMWLTAR
ncbi:MAG: hypothetical protein OEZ33_10340 [Gammaproteobacteria bacterium]|nr:hypothetical protein [Gammaproteobacteria bacterium]MDH5778602.1 hypothetical protein [Gammaproteobacteria bacterium]